MYQRVNGTHGDGKKEAIHSPFPLLLHRWTSRRVDNAVEVNSRNNHKGLALQRSARQREEPQVVPKVVSEVLHSSGQPLDANNRHLMESRFGHDFSSVRVHTDPRAAHSAQAVDARAYTVGHHMVFAPGQYAPSTQAGRRLLIHELIHVAQQTGTTPIPSTIRVGPSNDIYEREAWRRTESGDVRSCSTTAMAIPRLQRVPLLEGLARLFGGGTFSEQDLQEYLELLDSGHIEGRYDSDNKARDIIRAWRRGGSEYVLTARRKLFLIKEILNGITGNEDEQMILELLQRSHNFELRVIFGTGGVSAAELDSKFQGAEQRALYQFFHRRFIGGADAVRNGQIEPRYYPVPLGIEREEAGDIYDISQLDAFLHTIPDSEPYWNMACVLGILCQRDRAVVDQLRGVHVYQCDRIEVTRWRYDNGGWTSETASPNGIADDSVPEVIIARQGRDCDDVAEILFHEVCHLNQSRQSMPDRYHREIDAYTRSERWAIERGFPEPPGTRSLRTMHPTTGLAPDPTAIDAHVRRNYGGPDTVASDDVIVLHGVNPDITIFRSGSERLSQEGDTYIDDSTLQYLPILEPFPDDQWECPEQH